MILYPYVDAFLFVLAWSDNRSVCVCVCLFEPQGTWQKFVDFEWKTVAVTDLLQVTKTEGQVRQLDYVLAVGEK